jgi:Lon-like protease
MRPMRKPRWPIALAVAFAIVAAGFTYGWETQSGYYAFLPDPAHPLAKVVHAQGGKAPAKDTGFYFVDVNLLHANLIQKFWAEHLVDGASLVPDKEILAPGQSNQQRVHEDLHAMTTSQETDKVVAERALGKKVPILRQGALLLGIVSGDPAAKAGLQPGTIVTSVNGQPVHSAQDLIDDMHPVKPGQSVRLTLSKGDPVRVRTIASPKPVHAIIGVSVGDAVRIGKLPVPVKIDTGDIGGPSAGLGFALEIYDSLSGRQLLHGHKIAVTGELDLAGGVHEIGGVQQKTIGAIDAGADTFLVPKGDNLRDATAAAKGRIHVIGVTSFAQALQVIRGLPPR